MKGFYEHKSPRFNNLLFNVPTTNRKLLKILVFQSYLLFLYAEVSMAKSEMMFTNFQQENLKKMRLNFKSSAEFFWSQNFAFVSEDEKIIVVVGIE